MNKRILEKNRLIYILLFLIITGLLLVQCDKDEEPEDCNARTKSDQYYGYEVWAGDSALWKNVNSYEYYYNIDKYYTLIGTGTATKTFNTADYKYYVIAARWYCCIDAIEFADRSYYNISMIVNGMGVTNISGLADFPPGTLPDFSKSRFLGPPDGISGNLGYKDLCKEPNSYGGYITDTGSILLRGGGLTIYVVDNCIQ